MEFDPETKRGKGIALPSEISNRKAITALVLGPDAMLWMMVEGWLVIYNPAVARFEHVANLFPNVVYTPSAAAARLQDASLVVGRDGWVYGTSQGRVLFKLHPSTRERITLSATEGGTGLIADRAGDLYFHRGSRLFRYRP